MSGTDWNELERAWQSLPAGAAPVVEELKRARRWQWFSRLFLVGDVVMTLAGFAAAGWLLLRGDTFSVAMAVATTFFVVAAAGASFWARSLARVRHDEPVMQATQAAIHRVETGLRLARATVWCVCAALVYLAVFAIVVQTSGTPGQVASGYTAVSIALVWFAIVLAGTVFYERRRTADLGRLKALEATLKPEV
jgi:hypothetical protein